MTERLIVYRVQSWRHVCYLRTLEEALAHLRVDLDRAHPGQIEISRHRVSVAFLDNLPQDCDHPGMGLSDAEGAEGEAEAVDDAPIYLTDEQLRRLGGRP